jgi:lysophospholipase L1-like esterase
LAIVVCVTGLVAPASGAGPKVELRDGDRVVLVGDALIERDQEYGYLETLLTIQNPDKTITFRNLGWSGDTVFGEARAGFGTPADGFKDLKEHVLALKPTVVIVGYGMADSFAGEAGLPRFVEGLNTLLDVIAETGARVILLSPIRHEDLGRPLPDPAEHNRSLRLYRDAIAKAAETRGHKFIDNFGAVRQEDAPARDPAPRRHFTDDGIHLNEVGYWIHAWASVFDLYEVPDLGLPFGSAALIHHNGQVGSSIRAKIAGVEPSTNGLRFVMTCETLPLPPPTPRITSVHAHRLHLVDLPPGRYTLKIDGRPVARADATEWLRGVVVDKGPEFDQVERLRKTINEKNRLYFYRWRPQNETYLFGFRKHEQGNNAREIPLFDPLVDAKEKEIAALRKPMSHVYELVREGEEGR